MAGDIVLCSECGFKVPFHRRTCPICEESVGFPNVRRAQLEESELLERYKHANTSASARNVDGIVRAFEKSVEDSHVVIVLPLNKLIEVIENENKMIATFVNEVAGNSRLAESNVWDQGRGSVESALHPIYHKEIHCAAMSLCDYGVKYYGKCHIKLNSTYIKNRTSFFEENPFIFFKKHNHIAGDPLPRGYRAIWESKAKLAVAKLHSQISSATVTSDFISILVRDDDSDSDFIEAHIFGSMHSKLFESIVLLNLETREIALFNAYEQTFSDKGISVRTE